MFSCKYITDNDNDDTTETETKSVQSWNGREVSTKVLRRISAGGARLVAAWEKLRWWKVD